jgi:hypothetical protein
MRPSVGSFEEGRTDLKFEIAQAAAERRLSNPECYRGNRALDTGRRLRAKPDKKIVDGQAAIPSW